MTQQHHQYQKRRANMILPNQAKKKNFSTRSKDQTTRAENRIARKFPNSREKYKLTTLERSGQPAIVPTASIIIIDGIKHVDG